MTGPCDKFHTGSELLTSCTTIVLRWKKLLCRGIFVLKKNAKDKVKVATKLSNYITVFNVCK